MSHQVRALQLVVVGACLCTGGVLHAQKTLRAVERAFDVKRKTKDHFKAKRKALLGLRGDQSAAAVKALVLAYSRLDAEAEPLRRERAHVLVTRTSLEVARFRKKLDPIDTLQDLALSLVRELDSRGAANAMLDELVAHSRQPSPILSLQLALAKGASRMSEIDTLRAGLRAKLEPGARVALGRIVRGLGPRGRMFGAWAESQLGHESATLRLESAHTLAAIGARKAVPRLIDRLEAEDGAVKQAFADALHRLTAQPHGLSAPAWKAWLEAQKAKGADFAPPKGGTIPPPPKPKNMGTYFGIPQLGRSILYVFDNSDSMARGLSSGGSRIRRSRRELGAALDKLEPQTLFNIVQYSIKVRPWQRSMVSASAENIAAAKKWLRELSLGAGTSSYDALERSFALAGSRRTDRFDEIGIETMFFLSDGEPTRRTGGTMQPLVRDDPNRILSAVRRWNALDRVTIHTIGIGLSRANAAKFMEALAGQNRGRFVAVR